MRLRRRVVRSVMTTALREYGRTPEAIFWSYGFPLVMALVLGLAFARGEPRPARVAVVAEGERCAAIVAALAEHGDGRIDARAVPGSRIERGLAFGEFDVAVSGTPRAPDITWDATRPEAQVARLQVVEALREASGFVDVIHAEMRQVERPGDRYIDFLIPGLIGINLMGAGLFGIGHNLVLLRARHLLRRFAVTPMGRAEFLLGYLLSRFVLALIAPLVILGFGMLVFDVPMLGSWSAFVVLVLLGAIVFSGLGLLLATRARSLETVSGLMNLVMLPMWLLGGAFFSNDRFPAAVQPLVQALPLTHLTDALREVSRGGGLTECSAPALALVAFTAAFFALALKLFRWN